MGFNKRSQQRIGDVVRRVEKSPINAGTGKRQRRQQAGNKSKLFRVKKAKDGDDFVEYIDYHSLSFGETYHFQCAPYDYPSQTEETDEEKWENVLNLASEWIPQDTIIEAWNIKGEWYCHFQRTTPPTIIVQGTASPSGPTYENFSLSVEMCSLGRVQHEIEENDEEITLSVANYTGRYVDDGFKCVAIGYGQYQGTEYYDRKVDLYGDSYSDILAGYDFVLIDAGCGGS